MSVFFKRAAARALMQQRLAVSASQQRHQPFSLYAVNHAQNDPRGGAAMAHRATPSAQPGQKQEMPQAQQQQIRQQQQNTQHDVQKARPSSQPGQSGSANRSQQEASLGIRHAAGQVQNESQQKLHQNASDLKADARRMHQPQGQQYGQQQSNEQQHQQNQGQDRQNDRWNAQPQQQQQQQRGQMQQQNQQQNRMARSQQQDDDDMNENTDRNESRGGGGGGNRDRNSSGRQMMNRSGDGDNIDGGSDYGRPSDRIKPNRYLKKAPTGLIESFNANYEGRDTKNFPRLYAPRYPMELRHFFIPRSYFDFFYEKTGATGGYAFGIGLITFLISKEFFIFEHEANMFVPLCILGYAVVKYGMPHVNKMAEGIRSSDEQSLIEFQEKAMDYLQEELDLQDNRVYSAEASVMLAQAKRENVALQQEALYRQRLKTAYDEVKKRLDYLAAVQAAQRRAEKKHMMNWVLENVRRSLSDQSEKDALRACVDALNNMKPATH